MVFDGTCGVWLPLADARTRDAFLKALRDFVPTIRELECTRLIMQTGNKITGLMRRVHYEACAFELIMQTGNKITGLSSEEMHANCIETLKRGGDIAAENNIDRKSTRLNSSHGYISYAVFCLKKKKASR